MRRRHSTLLLLLIPFVAATLYAQPPDHTYVFPDRPAQWEALLWPRAPYSPAFTPSGAAFARARGGLDTGALRERAGVWEIFIGDTWVRFDPAAGHTGAARNYYRLGGGWGGGQASGNIHQEAQHWHADLLGIDIQEYMRLHTMESVDLDYNRQLYHEVCRAHYAKEGKPCPSSSGGGGMLSSVPAELSFELTGQSGRFVQLLQVHVGGSNQRWAASISSPLKPEGGGTLHDLKLTLAPRGGAGAATIEVAMEVDPGVAPGRYAAQIQLSSGALIPKVKVPVAVFVGIVPPKDPDPDPVPVHCVPLPNGGSVRFKVTEVATGKADAFVSAEPCPP